MFKHKTVKDFFSFNLNYFNEKTVILILFLFKKVKRNYYYLDEILNLNSFQSDFM